MPGTPIASDSSPPLHSKVLLLFISGPPVLDLRFRLLLNDINQAEDIKVNRCLTPDVWDLWNSHDASDRWGKQ
jgi:hypothetical protein